MDAVRDVAGDREVREELSVLEDEAKAAAMNGHGRHVLAVERDGAGGGLDGPDDGAEQR